jgi:hypothetical protein
MSKSKKRQATLRDQASGTTRLVSLKRTSAGCPGCPINLMPIPRTTENKLTCQDVF